MYGEFNADKEIVKRYKAEIEKERAEILSSDGHHLWKEWFDTTWNKPTDAELQRRLDEVDPEGLPFEYMKVYN